MEYSLSIHKMRIVRYKITVCRYTYKILIYKGYWYAHRLKQGAQLYGDVNIHEENNLVSLTNCSPIRVNADISCNT